MELKASKVLQAALGDGYVPASIICVGPVDETKPAATGLLAVKKPAAAGHARMLSCNFEPAGQYTGDAPTKVLELLAKSLNAKVVQSGGVEIAGLPAKHVELHLRSGDGVPIALHGISLVVTGMVHRYTLSIIQEKSQDGREALLAFAAKACSP